MIFVILTAPTLRYKGLYNFDAKLIYSPHELYELFKNIENIVSSHKKLSPVKVITLFVNFFYAQSTLF